MQQISFEELARLGRSDRLALMAELLDSLVNASLPETLAEKVLLARRLLQIDQKSVGAMTWNQYTSNYGHRLF